MRFVVAQVVGLFLVVVGCGAMVAAAALVSTALAVLAAGAFLVLGGVLVVYVGEVLGRAARTTPVPDDRRPRVAA